jgi:hypothetical protein
MAQGERLADEALMTDLHRILRRMIVRSFPKLRRFPIEIRWGLETDDLLLYSLERATHLIRVNDALRPAPVVALEGGLAHELCHIDADMAMGRFQRALAWERYARSRWFRTREERATELRVIDLGYGPHLLAFVRFARRIGYTFEREHGLLYAEIARLAISRRSGRTA